MSGSSLLSRGKRQSASVVVPARMRLAHQCSGSNTEQDNCAGGGLEEITSVKKFARRVYWADRDNNEVTMTMEFSSEH